MVTVVTEGVFSGKRLTLTSLRWNLKLVGVGV